MRRRLRLPGLLAVVVVVGLIGPSGGAVWAGPASIPATAPPTTVGNPLLGLLGKSTTTVPRGPATTVPRGAATPRPGAPVAKAPSTSTPTTTTTTTLPAGDGPLIGVVPPADQAIINGIVRTPPGSTAPLLAALRGLGALGLTPTQAAEVGFGRFPVAGPATWTDDWYEPRFNATGGFGFHMGIDVVAACGTPLRAAAAGTLRQGSDPAGGTNAEITEPDGSYIYMAHLSGYEPGQSSGQQVRVGDVIGFVGATGDATGCHLHIELHPRGGPAVSPKPFLDAWAAEAIAAAPLLVDAMRADRGMTAIGKPLAPSGVALAPGPRAAVIRRRSVPALGSPVRSALGGPVLGAVAPPEGRLATRPGGLASPRRASARDATAAVTLAGAHPGPGAGGGGRAWPLGLAAVALLLVAAARRRTARRRRATDAGRP